jgi:DNA-directed RNA polymerase subunit N (RpoN/RPB10)
MYPYIVCYCGRSIGDLYDAFKLMRLKAYLAELGRVDYNITPNMLAISGEVSLDLSSIFEELGLNLECCRDHIATQAEFKNIY